MTTSKRRYSMCLIGIITLLFSRAVTVRAHDVVHEISKTGAVVVTVGYDTGEAMRYAAVTIFSPRDDTVEFQNGRTDANGSFAFVPDMPGEWKIIVNDGIGHGLVTTFLVDASMNVEIKQGKFARLKKLMAGIGMLLGVTGLISYLRARKILTAQSFESGREDASRRFR